MADRVIYTWAIGRRLAPQARWPDWAMLCYSDRMPPPPWVWIPVERPEHLERGNRRAKLMPPFEARESIYIDANVELLAIPAPSADIAIHTHRDRDCIFDEINACIEHRKADPDALRKQAATYADHPRHWGLWECAMIYRRHTPEVLKFCEKWHTEIERHTHRDQVSLPVVARSEGMRIESLGASVWSGMWTRKHRKK
jgi:hypothetical protein